MRKNFNIKQINFLDAVFVAIFLILALSFYLFFYRKPEYVDIRVRVTDKDILYASTNPQSWYANRLNVGDTELNELGGVISKITNKEVFNMSADSKVVYLDLNLKAVYDRRTKIYSAKGSSLTFGNSIKFNFANSTFNGLITESPQTFKQPGPETGYKTLSLLVRGPNAIEPEILQKIKKGDKITNSLGHVLVEVKDVYLKPGQRVTQDDRGNLHLKADPFYKDAFITVSMRYKKYNGEDFIYDLIPLKIGMYIPLNFSYTTVYPLITDIKDN